LTNGYPNKNKNKNNNKIKSKPLELRSRVKNIHLFLIVQQIVLQNANFCNFFFL
jgi:hypothetical protein